LTFYLGGSSRSSASLHVARTVCRRLERSLAKLDAESIDPAVFPYINRLSDFLFVAARVAAKADDATEIVYQKKT
jgi:cob(I)alamin adenosyltransferase